MLLGGQQLKKHLASILLVTLSAVALASPADEIGHLLAFVESTGCTYERNGEMHSGTEAAKHINKKFKYFSGDIETAEDFIKYSATKSKISGKYYKVHCGDQPPLKSRDWLLAELNHYRSSS